MDKVFYKKNHEQFSTYDRLLIFKKNFKNLKFDSNLYEIEIKFPQNSYFESRYVLISEKCMFFYGSKREYLMNKNSYDQVMILLRPDSVTIT